MACGFALAFTACTGTVCAAPPQPAPEIDPGSIGNAIALLTGGFLIIKSWRYKKQPS
jgi:hypothetical protein